MTQRRCVEYAGQVTISIWQESVAIRRPRLSRFICWATRQRRRVATQIRRFMGCSRSPSGVSTRGGSWGFLLGGIYECDFVSPFAKTAGNVDADLA